MKKIYVVQNSNEIVLGVFKKKRKAKDFVREFGKKIWKEKWDITAHKLNAIEDWVYKKG